MFHPQIQSQAKERIVCYLLSFGAGWGQAGSFARLLCRMGRQAPMAPSRDFRGRRPRRAGHRSRERGEALIVDSMARWR